MNPSTHTTHLSDLFTRRIAARLDEAAEQTLPADIAERLRFSRERALARARQSRALRQAATAVAAPATPAWAMGTAGVGSSSSGQFQGPGWTLMGRDTRQPGRWWAKLVSALPLLVLAGGLLMIQQHLSVEQLLAAVEIDSALLADDLPPAAYSDPGFREYLRSGTP